MGILSVELLLTEVITTGVMENFLNLLNLLKDTTV